MTTALAATAVLVPLLGSDDRSDATAPAASPTTAPELDLVVGGSTTFAGRTLPLLEDPAGPFPGVRGELSTADLALVDLAVVDPDTPLTDGAAAALVDAGADLVAVTSTTDGAGTAATLDALTATGLRPVGAGQDATAAATPQRVEVDGQGVTVVGLSLARDSLAAGDTAGLTTPAHSDAVLAAVGVAAVRGDLVVVRLSGAAPCGGDTLATTERLVQAGADVMLGVGDVPAGSWSVAGDHRAWSAPSPGPLLSADEQGPTTTGLLRLTVRSGTVVGSALDTRDVDGFGRARGVTQTSDTRSDVETDTEGPCGVADDPPAGS